MQRIQLRVIAYIIIVAALCSALQIMAYRLPYEGEMSGVEIGLEYGDLCRLAALTGEEPLKLLQEFHQAGLTALVFLDDQGRNLPADIRSYMELSEISSALQLSNRADYLAMGVIQVLLEGITLPGLNMVFFAGYEVLGWPEQVDDIASALAYIGLTPGWVEMLGTQQGLDKIMEAARYQMIRIHPGYPYEDLEDMARSARERSIRFLYLKPFKNMGLTDPYPEGIPAPGSSLAQLTELGSNREAGQVVLSWITTLRLELLASGLQLGGARPFPALTLSKSSELYLQLGVLGGLVLLVSLWGGASRFTLTCLLLVTASGLGLMASFWWQLLEVTLLRDIFALLAACVFPVLGLMQVQESWAQGEYKATPWWEPGVRALLQSSSYTLVGGILINAMLSEAVYRTAWTPFRGVKIALIVPPLLILAQALWLAYQEGWRFHSLKQLSLQRLGGVMAAALIIGTLTIWRSGNEAASISGIERLLRVNLEQMLGVRPRFKEFFLGHPALMLLGWSTAKTQREIGHALLAVAAIAQASLFNSFMHLHTPMLLSLRRSLWGIALGEILGIIALLLLARLKQSPPSEVHYEIVT
ncbi:MAG: DUF5693 family protein [Symbiobacteriaceae bacterium]|nr:DUF5693 family protein [Symbiobacteriaceae bacterium]